MAITITCSCGKRFKVEEELAGRQVQCQCGNIFTVSEKKQMPWKQYHKIGKQRFRRKIEQALKGTSLSILQEELFCYWGYLIGREAEEIGLEHFDNIQPVYQEWLQTHQSILNNPGGKKTGKAAKKLRKLSLEIGKYCYNREYSYKKFSDIAQVEEQLFAINFTIKCRSMADKFWKQVNRRIPLPFQSTTLFGAVILTLFVVLGLIISTTTSGVLQMSLFGATAFFTVMPFLWGKRKSSKEKKRLYGVWLHNLKQANEEFLPPELIQCWIDAIFQSTWKNWKYIPQKEIIIPDDLSGGFIPDVMFSGDTISQFGIDFDQEVELWSHELYKFCQESYSESGKVNVCYYYSENQQRIPKFLQRMYQIMGEMNECQGEELVWTGQYSCTTPNRLGIVFSLVNSLLVAEKFPKDLFWSDICSLFSSLDLIMNIYESEQVAAKDKNQLQTPDFLDIFAGLRMCFYGMAKRRPLLLIIDNLDHGDPASMDFICSLTDDHRNHRICILISYDRESVLRMAPLKNTILRLQKQNCWNSPERESEDHIWSSNLIGKKNQWDNIKHRFEKSQSTSKMQLVGIHAKNGLGKTFFTRQFQEACCREKEQLWALDYTFHHNSENYEVLMPIQRLLESVRDNQAEIEATVYERCLTLLEFLQKNPEEKQASKKGVSWKGSKAGALAKKLSILPSQSLSKWQKIQQQRQNLYAEITTTLKALTSHRPLFLLLDDFHFADSATVRLLEYWGTKPPEMPLFILLAWDPSQMSKLSNSPERLLSKIKEKSWYLEVKLTTPDAKEMADYISEEWKPNLLAESPQSPFIKKLQEISDSNIFIFNEFLKWLLVTKKLYRFGGFWALKDDIDERSLTTDRILQHFVDYFPTQERSIIQKILQETSIYGNSIPKEYIAHALQKMDINEEDYKTILDKMLNKNILLKSSENNRLEFIHPQYRNVVYQSIPGDQKRRSHQQILDYMTRAKSQDFRTMLTHAENSHAWEAVLNYSAIIGKQNLELYELSGPSVIFDKALLAAQKLESLPGMAKYYLLKAQTFPSKQIPVNITLFRTALSQKRWQDALEMGLQLSDQAKTCEVFFQFIENFDSSNKEEFTQVLYNMVHILANVRSEYIRRHFMFKVIPLFLKADPLQLRSLVEKSIPVVEGIHNANVQSELFLLLQKQLGEMDLDLLRLISSNISAVRCGEEKALSVCLLASYISKNPGLVIELMNEAEEIANRVYQIMAFRGIAQNLLISNPEHTCEIFDKIAARILNISTHIRRMQALEAFLTGVQGNIRQQKFEMMISSLPDNYRLAILGSLLNIIQQTKEVPLRLECLKKLVITLTRISQADDSKELLETVIQEVKKLNNPFERSEGFLEIAGAVLQADMNLAHQYLEEGLQEIEVAYSAKENVQDEKNSSRMIRMLHNMLALLQKLPQPIVYPLWGRTINIAEQMESHQKDPILCDMTISLFPYDQEKAMQLAGQIHSVFYRHQTVKKLFELPDKLVPTEILEKTILDYAPESYGNVLLQQLAEKDTGRARRLLKKLPETVETQIASARLCKAPGQRIRELLRLSKGAASNEQIMVQIIIALESLLKKKEYDAQGSRVLLETIPDLYPEKIILLMYLTIALQEVDSFLACNSFIRIPALLEKHYCEGNDLQEIIEKISTLAGQLQPVFLETHIEKILPEVDVISDLTTRSMLISRICEKLKEVSPDAVCEILEQIDNQELRFQLLEAIGKDIIESNTTPIGETAQLDRKQVETLASLSMVESLLPALGQPLRQALNESIIACHDHQLKIAMWTTVLKISGNWSKNYGEFVLEKILEECDKIGYEEITHYYQLLETLQGYPTASRNKAIAHLIDCLTDHSQGQPPASLHTSRNCFWNALGILNALVPFGESHVHSFVMKLLAIPKENPNIIQTIDCINEFLFLCRGVTPEKESEWIAEAIGYLDAAKEESGGLAMQEDYYLLRAMNMVALGRSLVIYEPAKALQAAQRALQLTEYSERRHRLQRYILLQLSALTDVIQNDLREKQSDRFKPIEIMRYQWAYYHLQALKDIDIEQRNKFLHEEKNTAKELMNYLSAYLSGNLPEPDKADMEETWTLTYQQFESEIEVYFNKLLKAKPGPGLTQAFFVLAQALCLMDNESLSAWRRMPWFQRLVLTASRIDPMTLNVAGDDFLQADEKEEFALLVQRVSFVYPKSVLFLIKSMFSQEKVSELSASLEDEAISEELLKEMLPPLKNISLCNFRDRILTELALEWVEYSWADGFLLADKISDFDTRATTMRRLIRKSCDYYPDEVSAISSKACISLNKIKPCQGRAGALEEMALRTAVIDLRQAIEVINIVNSPEKQREIFSKVIALLDIDKVFSLALQIVDTSRKTHCLRSILCNLPDNVEKRMNSLERFWETTQKIQEDDLRIDLMKDIVRIGMREKDAVAQPKRIADILQGMWENISRVDKNLAYQLITATFPPFLKLLDNSSVRELFDVLYDFEYLPLPGSHGIFNTVAL